MQICMQEHTSAKMISKPLASSTVHDHYGRKLAWGQAWSVNTLQLIRGWKKILSTIATKMSALLSTQSGQGSHVCVAITTRLPLCTEPCQRSRVQVMAVQLNKRFNGLAGIFSSKRGAKVTQCHWNCGVCMSRCWSYWGLTQLACGLRCG